MTIDLSPLRRTLTKRGVEENSVGPVMALTLYCDKPLHEVAPRAAAALREYIGAIPADVMRSCQLEDRIGKMSKQRLPRDLRHLEQPAKHEDVLGLLYSSSAAGPPGDFGVDIFLADEDREPVEWTWSQLLRFEFPWDSAEGERCGPFMDTLIRIASLVPFSVGYAGFGFSYLNGDRFAREQVNAMLARYLGFEHSRQGVHTRMRDRTPRAHWLNFVSRKIIDQLGTPPEEAFRNTEVQVRPVDAGVVVRAAKLPPVGDVNKGATDVGDMPLVASWLKPLRFVPPPFGGTSDFDAKQWVSRLDTVARGPWNNR